MMVQNTGKYCRLRSGSVVTCGCDSRRENRMADCQDRGPLLRNARIAYRTASWPTFHALVGRREIVEISIKRRLGVTSGFLARLPIKPQTGGVEVKQRGAE